MFGHHSPPPVPTEDLTTAFMDMDRALSGVETGVADYRAVTGNTDLDQHWDDVRTQCFTASSTYVSLTATEPEVPVTTATVSAATEQLRWAAQAVENFKAQYSRQLNSGSGAIADITNSVLNAQEAAQKSRELVWALDPAFKAYPSVDGAAGQLDIAAAQLRAAWTARDYRGMPAAVQALTEASDQLNNEVAAAPGLAAEVERSLSSVSTRLANARTRLEGVAPALSKLFRDFAAASSMDLVDNEVEARRYIDQAADFFGRARAAQHQNRPGEAATLAEGIRVSLSEADQLIDAVTSRLRLLGELKADPGKRAEPVKFALRDARMFADSRGTTEQWAAALDIQQHRVELLETELRQAVHPDYWAYANGLDKIADFVQSVCVKMRENVSR